MIQLQIRSPAQKIKALKCYQHFKASRKIFRNEIIA
ncbi:hypothetical protein Bccel_1612 [Pseudobacteroides cellulosolvens ATCC 35603 = DSM 2933]|uniref:Uncharacterized protein n=1 Tax=Pseudobacteroides cellulosolvens ATCC 35603 = DSM 2933 TaxID=398512 RepID=A0A0L6JKR3_9FIRM|nr:hypothetical protein Bccel_1612 [Pseudobacteroides cellulosolvens ATCC 35603 = DSM 2933]